MRTTVFSEVISLREYHCAGRAGESHIKDGMRLKLECDAIRLVTSTLMNQKRVNVEWKMEQRYDEESRQYITTGTLTWK